MRTLIGGASVAFAIKIGGASIAFLYQVLLARTLGVDGAGAFFMALTVFTLASVLGRMGLDNTLLRFVSSYASVNDWASIKGVARKGVWLGSAATAAVALALYLSAPYLASGVFSKPEVAWPLRIMALALLPMTLLGFHAEMLKGVRKVASSLTVQMVLVWAFASVGLLVLGRTYGVEGAVWAYVLACAATAAMSVALWRRAAPGCARVEGGSFSTGSIFSSCWPLYAVALMNHAINWLPLLLLGVWGSKADVGVFGAASRTAMLLSYILVAVNSVIAPQFAALYHKGDMEGLGEAARGSTRLLTLLALPALLVFLLVPGRVMGVFGGDYVGGALLLSVMAAGQFVNVATGSVGQLLAMSGHERVLRSSLLVATAVSVALCLALIPPYGALGAALAVAASVSLQNACACYLVWRYLGISTLPLPLLR